MNATDFTSYNICTYMGFMGMNQIMLEIDEL